MTTTLIRRAGLVTAGAAVLLAAATPAWAEVPEGWSDPAEISFLQVLLVIGALPVAVACVIALFVYLPALRRGESVRPGGATEDQWFGGPREGVAELEPTRREVGVTGGGSGSW